MMYNEDKATDDQRPVRENKGRLISFEGLDGSGKTTQIVLLVASLHQAGKRVQVLREPGGTSISEAIREILLDGRYAEMCSEAELLLFSAARAQLVRQVILPALAAGTWVICDRFYDSTLAFQGYGRGMDLGVIRSLNHLAAGPCRPDMTVLLDLPVEQAMRRLQNRQVKKDRIEQENPAFMHRIREGYRQLAAAELDRWILMDAEQSETALAEQIYRVIREGFSI